MSAAHRVITVEPVFLLYTLGNGLRTVVFQTLLYQKVCVSSYNSSVCSNLQDPAYSRQEIHVQQVQSAAIYGHILVDGM